MRRLGLGRKELGREQVENRHVIRAGLGEV